MKRLIKRVISGNFKQKNNELDALLEKAAQNNAKSFLAVWNRGLGDIPLGLYAFTIRIRTYIPDAKITFITRKELADAFTMLDGTSVIGVPWWERGRPIDIKETFRALNLTGKYDIVFENINPTKWLSWQTGKVIPRLKWSGEHDELWKRFDLHSSSQFYFGVHINTETQKYYGYKKDWPQENWRILFEKISEGANTKIILFGINRTNAFSLPSIIDLRGETSLLEMLSIIKNRCSALIAPDGGVLSICYYIDDCFPLTVISLWGDSNQGILKQAVASPNKSLKHVPLIGRDNDIKNIKVDEVFNAIASSSDPE